MPDIFLYAGEPNPNDIRLGDPTVLRGGGGPVTYSYTGSGGLLLAGAATYALGKSYPVSGGLVFGGVGTVKLGKTYSPSGGLVFAGAANVTRSFTYGPTGGLVFSGTAPVVVTFVYLPTGGMVFGGSATTTGPEAPVVVGGSGGGYPYHNSKRPFLRQVTMTVPSFDFEADEEEIMIMALYQLFKD
jgi:hypothetical protein